MAAVFFKATLLRYCVSDNLIQICLLPYFWYSRR